jgi:hypothetical protein
MIEIDAKSVVIKAKCFIIGANVPAATRLLRTS